MSGFVQNLLSSAVSKAVGTITGNYSGQNSTGPVILRDYQHASKTFRTNSYQFAPKFKFLFHTYFSINVTQYGFPTNTNYGLLVKDIKLPQFSFNTSELNQYNRKRIIQTKIKYEPIEISFHDDDGDQVNKLWESYYRYYYNDTTKPGTVLPGNAGTQITDSVNNFNNRNIYSPGQSYASDSDWGFNGGQTKNDGTKIPFFKTITVFGFNQHNYTAYTLVNPIITSFGHDTYNYSEGGGTMQNRMTINYETVVYNYGNMDGKSPGNIVTGFGDPSHYDTTLSPIATPGSNGTVLGQGGLVAAAGGAINSLLNGGNVLKGVANAIASYNSAYAPPTTGSSNGILNAMLQSAIQTAPTNRNTPFNIPVAAATGSLIATAGSAVFNALTKPPAVTSQGSYTTENGSDYAATTPDGAPVAPDTSTVADQTNDPVGEEYNGEDLGQGLVDDSPFSTEAIQQSIDETAPPPI